MKFDPFPESIESFDLDPVVDKGQSLMSEKLPTHFLPFTSSIKKTTQKYE